MRLKIKNIILGMMLSITFLLSCLSIMNIISNLKDEKLVKPDVYDELFEKIELKLTSINKKGFNEEEKELYDLINTYMGHSKKQANCTTKSCLVNILNTTDLSFISFYTKIDPFINNETKKTKLASMIVTVAIQNEVFIQKNMYNYTLDFNDEYIFQSTLPNLEYTFNQSSRLNELYILEEVVDELFEVDYE